ncbi:unnamed protein product [Clavelina lepadiformis]|uniref:Glutathione S-transferase n=1 Tax=Clavelina lepadiformis TaxID=159417 RepID=A0ABP0GSS1_CLALP
MVLVLYNDPVSPSGRSVHMTLRALGLDFEWKNVNLISSENRLPEFLKINPRGKVPALVDEDLKLAESRAIACYLCNKYATEGTKSLYPSEPEKRAIVDQMLYSGEWMWEEIYIGYLRVRWVLYYGELPWFHNTDGVREALKYLDDRLKENAYMAGNHLTIADLFAHTTIRFLDMLDFDEYSNYPHMKAWMDKIEALDYYDECNNGKIDKVKEKYQALIKERQKQ